MNNLTFPQGPPPQKNQEKKETKSNSTQYQTYGDIKIICWGLHLTQTYREAFDLSKDR